MFIIDFFKTMSTVKKIEKYVNQHEETITKLKDKVLEAQRGIKWLEKHKADIELKITSAKNFINKVKGFIGK